MTGGRGVGARLSPSQRLDWLRLIRTENVGPRTFRVLVNQFGGAAAALDALPTLARRGGRLMPPRTPSVTEAEDEVATLERLGGRFVLMADAAYPEALRVLDDAPPVIAVRGRDTALTAPKVAIVGARNASAAGRTLAGRFARDLASAGFVVVSGLARGVDTAAHEASLDGGTIGVFAGGLARPYPAENIGLIERLVETGAIVSEMPVAWEARARDFPRRNRLVSGMSLGVLVVEAAERSGSLITARLAAEQGREVFAIPGSPLDPRAGGTNRLLKSGATLVTAAADVIEALRPLLERPRFSSSPFDVPGDQVEAPRTPRGGDGEPADGVRGRILELLSPVPTSIDDLVRFAGASAAEVQVVLLELELAGRLERQRGGRVALIRPE